ncbi:unnamed protein product [Rhizophagus irregularis]|nr:unnamed protein product [Rhizophagus irregularis]
MWVVWVGSAGGLGVWECGLGEGVGVGVGVWVGSVGMWVVWVGSAGGLGVWVFSLLDLLLGPFPFRLSLGLPSLCLVLLFIRSSFRPFFFSSLFRFTFSLSSSSLY